MKVLIVSETDLAGGAGIAAFRLCQALLKRGIEAQMLVRNKISDEDFVVSVSKTQIQIIFEKILSKISFTFIHRNQIKRTGVLHSGNWFGSAALKIINESDADIVNLHWINNEMLSLRQISRIKKKIVWTLHDMWLFCGGEHCTFNDNYANGKSYSDILNKVIFHRKRKYLKKNRVIVPSEWLMSCAKDSAILHEWPVEIIPNTLCLNLFRPLDKKTCRQILGIPCDKFVCAFGSMGKNPPPYKGSDLLIESLNVLDESIKEKIFFIDFGAKVDHVKEKTGVKVNHFGRILDQRFLPIFYNCLDVVLVPSRIDAFNQVASEAQSCGIPVVAFKETGVESVVEHLKTGYLANYLDVRDFANGIMWVVTMKDRATLMRESRDRAERLWSYEVVAEMYKKVFYEVEANDVNPVIPPIFKGFEK